MIQPCECNKSETRPIAATVATPEFAVCVIYSIKRIRIKMTGNRCSSLGLTW